MKSTLLQLSLLVTLTGSALAETALEIASGFDQQKITALKAYLEKNPAAGGQGPRPFHDRHGPSRVG
jgi:hypothetical protein